MGRMTSVSHSYRILLSPMLVFSLLSFLFSRGDKAFAQDEAQNERVEKVNAAIDRGVQYLLGEVEKQQTVRWDDPRKTAGQVALETYALVIAGVDVNHPLIRKNFEYLRQHALESSYTYTLACYAFALDAAIAQKEADFFLSNPEMARQKFKDNPSVGQEFRSPLASAVQRLAGFQNNSGGWAYPDRKVDNSNTQFAVLALGVGLKRNVPIDNQAWEKVVDHFLKEGESIKEEVKDRLTLMTTEEVAERKLRGKNPKEKVEVKVVSKEAKDGKPKPEGDEEGKKKEKRGSTSVAQKTMVARPAMPEIGTENIAVYKRRWKYNPERTTNEWNMTCSGLSSLLLARQALKGKLPQEKQESLNAAIRDGFGWIMVNWNASPQYYGMYSLEKVADIGEVKKFGSHDWYEEISNSILGAQRPNGGWPADDAAHGNDRVSTSFALLVLNRATALVMMTLLSQNPVNRIMVSGRRSDAQDPNDHSWVYVRDLDTTIHYPTLLRTIRLRPHPKLLQLLGSIVRFYSDEWKGELVPEMAAVRDAITNNEARKAIEGYLSDITGHKYEKWEDYLNWHKRWERLIQIGTHQKKERIPDLLNYYKHTTKSFPLKKTVLWALIQCKARDAIPLFLEDLKSNDPRLRAAAYDAFKAFYVEFPPPFDATGTQSVRDKQVEAIASWYEEQSKKS